MAKEPAREELDKYFRKLMLELTGMGIGFDGAPILLKSLLQIAIGNVQAHRTRAEEFSAKKEHKLIGAMTELLDEYNGVTSDDDY